MKKLNYKPLIWTICTVILCTFWTASAFSKVHFIDKSDSNNYVAADRPCQLKGYKISPSQCTDGKTLYDKCSNGDFYKRCECDTKALQYTATSCKDNKTLGGKSCAGTYYEKCECDSSVYKVTKDNCAAPKVPSGKSCDGKFESCACPSSFSESCPTPMIGVGETCGGKFQSCKCPEAWNSCSDMGPATGSDKCTLNGTTTYATCCSCVGFTKNLSDDAVAEYDTCPCNPSYKKIKTCKEGYALKDEKCVKVGCADAVKTLLEGSSYSSYGIFEGEKLGSSKKTYIVVDDVSTPIANLYNVNTISAAGFAPSLSSSSAEAKKVKELCTEIPQVKFTGSVTPTSPVTFTALKLSASTIYNDTTFTCTNCNIDVYSFYSTNSSKKVGKVYLNYNASTANASNMIFKASTLTIDSTFISKGYNFDIASQLIIGTTSGTKYSYPVFFEGISSSKKITIKTPFTRIRYAVSGFKYATVNSKKTLIGVNGSPSTAEGSLTADGDGFTAVTLYQTDWKMYDADSGSINNYVLYMGRLSILGFKKGLDADSNDNSYGNKIAWSSGTNSARCRVRGTQNHQKNGTNSCKNRIGNTNFYYLDTSGTRQTGNTGSYNSEWCKGSGGDGPLSTSVGKIYLNKYSWVNGGGKRLRLECY
ncbi:MAG: hypothetical protein ACK5N8_04215 [Alphaproteobacteria bacterium]